jgi:biotin carboxyl carrier protein
VVRLAVAAGARVAAGDTLLVLEAMKMEVEVKSPEDGVVGVLEVSQGDQVSVGQTLAHIERRGWGG